MMGSGADDSSTRLASDAPGIVVLDSVSKTAETFSKPMLLPLLQTKENDIANLDDQLKVMHRPIWKFADGFKVHLDGLLRAAAGGDIQARTMLGLNFLHCYNTPADQGALEVKLEGVYELNDGGLSADRISERYDYCEGVHPQQRAQFFEYLDVAAQDGDVIAQEVIGSITPEFFMYSQGYEKLDREEYIALRDGFMERKIEYLEQAAKNGSIRALIRLSSMNFAQNIGADGQVMAFAINNVVLELTSNNEVYNRFSWFVQRQYEQLSPEDIDRASEISDQWLTQININGTLYPRD